MSSGTRDFNRDIGDVGAGVERYRLLKQLSVIPHRDDPCSSGKIAEQKAAMAVGMHRAVQRVNEDSDSGNRSALVFAWINDQDLPRGAALRGDDEGNMAGMGGGDSYTLIVQV